MYKRLIMGLSILTGTVSAAPLDTISLDMSGMAINTNGNTAGIAQGERLLFVSAKTMGPAVRAMIKAAHGTPSDIILRITGNEVTVISDFASKSIKDHAHGQKLFKQCLGSITHEDGTKDYFCKGPMCELLGYAIDTQGNRAGIADDDVCYLQPDKKTIRCLSGTVIKNPAQRESALTGTPGYLSGAGYIGYMVSKPSSPSLMGSGKRIDFFKR